MYLVMSGITVLLVLGRIAGNLEDDGVHRRDEGEVVTFWLSRLDICLLGNLA